MEGLVQESTQLYARKQPAACLMPIRFGAVVLLLLSGHEAAAWEFAWECALEALSAFVVVWCAGF